MQECSAPKDLGRASTGAREQQRLERMAYGGVEEEEEEEEQGVAGADSAVVPGLVVIAGGKASAFR